MRIGIISDVHNNIVALNAVLDRFLEPGCDYVVCCGDIIGIGPFPEETVQRIMHIPDLIAVRGNHEWYLLDGMPTTVPNKENMGYEELEFHKWEHSLLSPDSVNFLRGLPYRKDFILGGFRFSVMHYCFDNSGNRYRSITRDPDIEDCFRMFSDEDSDVILYGHDHKPSVNRAENKLFANFGSLGCPAKDGKVARAGIITIENGKMEHESVNVYYEAEKVIAEIDRLSCPAAEEIKRIFFNVK